MFNSEWSFNLVDQFLVLKSFEAFSKLSKQAVEILSPCNVTPHLLHVRVGRSTARVRLDLLQSAHQSLQSRANLEEVVCRETSYFFQLIRAQN